MSSTIPRFSELPLDKKGPHHNAWGLYGKDDNLGTLNRLTNQVVQEASKEIQSGKRINLDMPLDFQGDLPFFGRQQFHQQIIHKSPRIVNDDIWIFNTQSSTQWDGLRHFGYQKEAVFYNGVTLDQIHGTNGVEKSKILGVHAMVERGGIVGRGVLLDYHAWRIKNGREHDPFASQKIPLNDLRAVLHDQGTELKFGDILLIRSGWTDAYHKSSRAEIEHKRATAPLNFTGVEQSEEMMEFLWENFAAAGGDHPSLEVWPTQEKYALHEVLLGGWGMPIGELFNLEELAEECKRLGRYTFFMVSQPCYVPGGVASPPNAVAIL